MDGSGLMMRLGASSPPRVRAEPVKLDFLVDFCCCSDAILLHEDHGNGLAIARRANRD